MDKFSYVGNGDVNAIEELFIKFQKDPNSVDKSWQDFFKGFEFGRTDYSSIPSSNGTVTSAAPESVTKEFKVINLINGYRHRGHLFTKTNPVRNRRKYKPDLGLDVFELEDKDLETVFQAGRDRDRSS
jgi:2-oxoglutarate dehydrogenase E1 component